MKKMRILLTIMLFLTAMSLLASQRWVVGEVFTEAW